MGAFDSDKTLGRGTKIGDLFQIGDDFILFEVEYIGEIEIPGNDLGPADKCVLQVADKLTPDQRKEASVIGATATKLKEADAAELPAVVKLIQFHSRTYNAEGVTVQWVRDWTQEEADEIGVPYGVTD